MTPSAIADSIVNLCAAIGLAVAMLALHRRDPGGPVTRRLLFLLGVVAALFLIRGFGWWHESAWLDRLSLIPAAAVPLGALIVTEGILRRHAPRHLAPCRVLIHIHTMGPPLYPLLLATAHHNQPVKVIAKPSLENQRRFHDGNGMWLPPTKLGHPFILLLNYGGMDNLVQLLNAAGECGFGQLRTVHGLVRIEDAWAEMLDDLLVDGLSGLHQLMRNVVRLNQMGTQFDEHLSHD